MWCCAVSNAPNRPAQAIPAYVVNLVRAADRRALMGELFSKRGIAVNWIAAVDARHPVGDEAERLAAMPSWGPWGEVHGHAKGCTLSHFKAFQALVDSGASHGLVMEDDIFVAEDLAGWLSNTDWIPADADVVKLERWRDDRLLVLLGPKMELPPRPGIGTGVAQHRGLALRRLHSKHSGTAGFIVSARFARAILQMPLPNVPIDHLLFNPNVSALARRSTVYQLMPALIEQGNEPPKVSTAAPSAAPRKSRRQSLVRGLAEVRCIHLYLFRILFSSARFQKIPFKENPL